MDKNIKVIHKRNILLLKIIAICFGIDAIINLVIDRSALLMIAPITALVLILISIPIYLKIWVKQTTYIVLLSVYIPFIYIMEQDPVIINYIFFWAALVVSSIYQRAKPVIISSCVANFLTIFYFFKYKDSMFLELEPLAVIYIIIFNLFLTIFLILSGRFIDNELWSKNEYLESYFKSTSDAIVIYDLSGSIIQVNESFERLTGYCENEMRNMNVDLIEGEHLDDFKKTIREIKKIKSSKTIDTVIRNKNGSLRYLILTITPVKNRLNTITGYIYIAKDITKLKLTEEALRRSEMLSVVGQLAAGIAHEIKNPVTVLSGFVQLMKQSDEGHSHQYYYEIMQSELNRILLITNEFLVLGKQQQTFEFVEKKIQLLIKEVVLLLKAEAEKNGVSLKVNIASNVPPINCNPNQLKQVFINIIKNGIESMHNGGDLSIEVSLDGNNEVSIMLIDEGCGMTKEVLAKVGTPFYTTKEDGTGLGMMVSHKIIESHNGRMDIESEVNVGTKIKIWLPIKNYLEIV